MSQALSLKCNQCGAQFKSVAEAQSHGEATGHSDFAESTEAGVGQRFPAFFVVSQKHPGDDSHDSQCGPRNQSDTPRGVPATLRGGGAEPAVRGVRQTVPQRDGERHPHQAHGRGWDFTRTRTSFYSQSTVD
jgi:hypothetical protein